MEIIYPNLYATEMRNGKENIPNGQTFSIFLIVNHTFDRDYIKEKATELLLAGGRSFTFFGEYSDVWHEVFDSVYVELFMNEVEEVSHPGATTIECIYEVDFSELIYEEIVDKTLELNVSLLIYDDVQVYKTVLKQVDWLKRKKLEFHLVRTALKEMNPYSLLPDAPVNEFYGEAERIAEKIKRTDSAERIAGYISKELNDSFEPIFSIESCVEYAKIIKIAMEKL